MKRILLLVFLLASASITSWAQCAMCRATLENNFSNGKAGIAAGINVGILYLLVMPYLAVMTLGYFWYRSSKKNGNKNKNSGNVTR
jgi:hypothetical protein